jgi:chromate transporter
VTYLTLFLTFLKIGAFTFGGGYAMIALIRDECLANGWLSEGELLNYIAVAESTPGPIAINMATFVGSSTGGILGAMVATLGVILPSLVIILLIAAVFTRFSKYPAVKAILGGIRPVIVALITGTGATMLLSLIFGIKGFKSSLAFDWRGLVILVLVAAISFGYTRIRKKALSPIFLIIFSGMLGVLLFGF